MTSKINNILVAGLIMGSGILLLKYIPESIYGEDILFDASLHLTTAIFVLYIFWFFIDQNKSWRTPYFIFCFLVLAIISMQRILTNNHNDIGLLLGLLVGIFGISVAEFRNIKNKIKF